MTDRKKIEDIISEALTGTDIYLVDLHVSRSNVIQVFIDTNVGVTLDDCTALHRKMAEQLDQDTEDYELQVSSPGLGQPIRVFPQYQKVLGQILLIELEEGENVRGTLLEARPATPEREAELVVRIAGTRRKPAPEEPVGIQVSRIKSARVEIDFKQL